MVIAGRSVHLTTLFPGKARGEIVPRAITETPTDMLANAATVQKILHSKKEGKDQVSINQVPFT